MAHLPSYLRRTGICLWILGIVLLYALHFAHLAADFPAFPQWKDASVLTDEGWYLNAPTRYALTGHWYIPGDFNPAIALPVWPLLGALLFHFTGPGIVPARAFAVALFGTAIVCLALVLRRRSPLWIVLLVVSFAASSPFLFAFSRVALIEPLLLCLLAAAMLLADHATPVQRPRRHWTLMVVLGAVLLLMTLAKISSVFLYPAALYLLWSRLRSNLRRGLASFALLGALVGIGYALYVRVVSRLGYEPDFRYFYTSNAFGHPANLKGWIISLQFGLVDLWGTCGWLAILAVVVFLASLTPLLRSLWSEALYVASVVLIVGTSAFTYVRDYHAPHYYLFTPFGLAIVFALGLNAAMEKTPRRYTSLLVLPVVALLGVSVIRTVALVRYPTYTFRNAANSITDIIARDPSSRRLLLAESGDQITLITGQPSICDAFGAAPLREEINQRGPGWYAAWDAVNPETLMELHTRYHLQRVAAFAVSSDPGRSVLLFYRLVPLSQPETGVLVRKGRLKFYRRPPSGP
ncbi:MAG TPA: hypothetical protein VF018_04570 [Acidobacteriaceae bacterium]